MKKEKIIVHVRGGVAYCDHPNVEIIDHDEEKEAIRAQFFYTVRGGDDLRMEDFMLLGHEDEGYIRQSIAYTFNGEATVFVRPSDVILVSVSCKSLPHATLDNIFELINN